MMSFTMITASLLCSLSWISVSVSECQTVEVQLGEEVTLLCSNFSSSPTQIIWFTLANRTQPRCISCMYNSVEPATFCNGFESGKYEMTSNISTVSLKIKHVDSSDSGLYFCGFFMSRYSAIASATFLEVHDEPGEITNLTSVILGGVTVLLTKVIICLVVKMMQRQTVIFHTQRRQKLKLDSSATSQHMLYHIPGGSPHKTSKKYKRNVRSGRGKICK